MYCGRVNMGFVKKGEEGGKEEREGEGGKGGRGRGEGRREKEEEVEVAEGGYAQVRDVRL